MPNAIRSAVAGATATLTLAVGALATWGQPAEPTPVPAPARPTAIEVAAVMTACLAPQSASSVVATGSVAGADVEERGEVTMLLYRKDGDPRMRAVDAEFWLNDDPIQPPVVLTFKQSPYDYPPELRRRAVDCFSREYRRLLRA